MARDILIMAHDGVKIDREGALCLLKLATKTTADKSGLNTLLGQVVPPSKLVDFYSAMTD